MNTITLEDRVSRLRAEITAKRNAVLTALDRHEKRRSGYRINDIRHEISVLQGMCYSYLYVTGKWDNEVSIRMSVETNDLIMLWLSVDILKMRQRAAKPKKQPKTEEKQDSTSGAI